MRVEPLSVSSRFAQTATIEQLITELMIEQLTTTIDFSTYYAKCNPTFCTYSYTRRFDILFIITMVINVFGGLSTILSFLSPLLMKLIFKILKWKKKQKSIGNNDNQQLTNSKMPGLLSRQGFIKRWHTLINILKSTIWNLNLFKSLSQNTNTLHQQRATTWTFIACLTIILAIFSFYWFLSTQTKIVTISNPSRVDYDRLWLIHLHNLQCPCSQISISHSDFIHIEPYFHQLCSSKITSPDWYERLAVVQELIDYSKMM
ncbi:unnamed protein product [Rotaria sp. Silwood2]|nr:unnamed protein product [Rotaria sp. Silwood2]